MFFLFYNSFLPLAMIFSQASIDSLSVLYPPIVTVSNPKGMSFIANSAFVIPAIGASTLMLTLPK